MEMLCRGHSWFRTIFRYFTVYLIYCLTPYRFVPILPPVVADYHYYCCGKWYEDAVDDLMRQPCPRCGTRNDPSHVSGIPFVPREFVPRYDNTFGTVVKSRREEKVLNEQFGTVPMTKSEWTKQIREPVEHELWKQERGLPAFEAPVQMPSVMEVKDGLERVRARLANDDRYRQQFDPEHPGFKHANRGPES